MGELLSFHMFSTIILVIGSLSYFIHSIKEYRKSKVRTKVSAVELTKARWESVVSNFILVLAALYVLTDLLLDVIK
ncbi:hypothetical protein [Mesobacillus maritimus]|uniref:hypothetical protein n=1 Tax=Mesobacillus maritimus TaxID=1643336 RepID=UPI00384E93E0